MTDPEIIRLRARWDQVEAMVREAEAKGEDIPNARFQLAFAKEMIDHAERLEAIEVDE